MQCELVRQPDSSYSSLRHGANFSSKHSPHEYDLESLKESPYPSGDEDEYFLSFNLYEPTATEPHSQVVMYYNPTQHTLHIEDLGPFG